jgi:hypothetical protein
VLTVVQELVRAIFASFIRRNRARRGTKGT